MKKLLFSLLFCIALSALAQNSEKEERLITAFVIITDWATTRDMSKRYDEGYYETGYVLTKMYGIYPKTNQVDSYFLARLFLHYFISNADFLTYNQRKMYYTLTLFDHGNATVKNLSIGLKIAF